MALSIVVLAAGQGKRMRSTLPKVLHSLGGKPLLAHVLQAINVLAPEAIPHVVYGHGGEQVKSIFKAAKIHWVYQEQQLGTGHAVLQALPNIPAADQVLILCGDTPLISSATLQYFLERTPPNSIGLLTANFSNPFGFGRIIRDRDNKIVRIVEEKDATLDEKKITEINTGIYLLPAQILKQYLPTLNTDNQQKEYYLTDIVRLACQNNIPLLSTPVTHLPEVQGVNDCVQLADLERNYQLQKAKTLLQQGLTLLDPNRIDIRGELTAGHDVIFDINVIIEGKVSLGNHCHIGAGCILKNVSLGDHVTLLPYSVIEGASIASHCQIGPFARIRPGTEIAQGAQVGNFIEIKNSIIGENSKAHHVGYLGDTTLGSKVNIGAGTITCNYDGTKKHRTIIGDHAFIGSNSSLVAPLIIGAEAYIGAGSTITREAPTKQLTVSRAKQRSIENWQPKKNTCRDTERRKLRY